MDYYQQILPTKSLGQPFVHFGVLGIIYWGHDNMRTKLIEKFGDNVKIKGMAFRLLDVIDKIDIQK